MKFVELMALEALGEDRFLGRGPDYPWGGLYGGQLIGQALRAAYRCVEAGRRVHSLHAYFVAPGRMGEAVEYRVQRVRDGRSFSNRQVTACQAGRCLFTLGASFQAPEPGPEVDWPMPADVPAPEGLPARSWSPLVERRFAAPGDPQIAPRAWFRVTEPLPADDGVLQDCALAFLSDDLPTETVAVTHPARPVNLEAHRWASLDHSVWFHRRAPADEWCLYDFTGQALSGARGLAFGRVFSRAGAHLASVAQEVMVRDR